MPQAPRLFVPKERQDSRPHDRHAESVFEFYDRVGPSPLWDEVRVLLDEWLREHPDAIKLHPRLKQKHEFNPVFWELYVHEIFRRLGYQADVERADTNNRPDYVFYKGSTKLVVECWSSASAGFDKTFKVIDGALKVVPYDDGPSHRLGEVLNDKIVSPNLAVTLDDVDATAEYPAYRKICGPVQAWIDSEPRIGDQMRFTAADWSFTLATLPRPNEEMPFVAIYPAISVDPTRPTEALLNGIRDKARKKYLQHEEELFVIAANFPSTILKSKEVEAALYRDGGLWSNGRYRRVNGVLLGKLIQPLTVATSLPTLWFGPHAAELDLPFETARLASSGLIKVEGSVTARELFNLPAEWGKADPFPSAR